MKQFLLKPVAAGLAICVLVLIGMNIPHTIHADSDTDSIKALPVRTITVKIDNGHFARRSFTGRAISGRTSNMAFELNGTLKMVAVDIGEPIEKGNLLAALDTDRLEANKSQLLAERNEVASNLELAERTLERVNKTHNQGHTSAQRLDEAQANAISLQARLNRLTASIMALDIDLAKASIKAPYSGVITNRYLDEGTIVAAGTPIVEITETSRMEGHIGMPPEHANAIKNGASFTLYNGRREKINNPSLRSIVPIISGQTRTMMVTFDLPPEAVTRGEIINAVVENWYEQVGAWVPVRALSADVRGMWRIYKVAQNTTPAHVEFENVQIIYTDGNRAFVSGTISDGDIIIADGIDRLAPGQQVSLAPTGPNGPKS